MAHLLHKPLYRRRLTTARIFGQTQADWHLSRRGWPGTFKDSIDQARSAIRD